jgi:hypothetical protein
MGMWVRYMVHLHRVVRAPASRSSLRRGSSSVHAARGLHARLRLPAVMARAGARGKRVLHFCGDWCGRRQCGDGRGVLAAHGRVEGRVPAERTEVGVRVRGGGRWRGCVRMGMRVCVRMCVRMWVSAVRVCLEAGGRLRLCGRLRGTGRGARRQVSVGLGVHGGLDGVHRVTSSCDGR